MLKVFITVDVEVWPRNWSLGHAAFQDAWDRYILGITPKGDYGVPYQLRVLEEYQLRAVFLVESLFAWQYGISPLRDIVNAIREGGQEVQLHLHPEWSHKSERPIFQNNFGEYMRDYTEAEQDHLISLGMSYLNECGVDKIHAFRAGGYGANHSTLRMLVKHEIHIDTSYNAPYLPYPCGLSLDGLLVQPCRVDGLWEFPVGCFEEFPGRIRHMQLSACSLSELTHLLMQAWHDELYAITIVSHGHELLNSARTAVDPIMLHRFNGLCGFLAEHRDKFETSGFSDLQFDEIPKFDRRAPLSSHSWRTAVRYGEQMARRLWG